MTIVNYNGKNLIVKTIVCIVIGVLFYLFRDVYIDDAYISFTYIKNFIAGNGWVFNKGEYVEGLTNIGWAFILIPFCSLFPIPIAAKFLSLLLFLTNLFLLHKISKKHFSEESWSLLTILGPLFSFSFVYFSFSGMATTLTSCLFLLVLYFLDTNCENCALFTITMTYLVRPEVIVILPFYLMLLRLSGKPFKVLRKFIIFILLIGLITVSRYVYFGSILPNTFISKYTTLAELFNQVSTFLLNMNSINNIDLFFSNYFAIGFIIAGWYSARATKIADMGAAIIICGYIFSVYAKEDWTVMARYFAPYIPVAFLFLLIGIQWTLSKTVSKKNLQSILVGLGLTLIFTGCMDFNHWIHRFKENEYPMYVMNMQKLIPAAQWISANTPKSSVIATRRIGCLSFYSDRYIFDYRFGLTDKRVARLVRKNKKLFQPNDDLLKDLWLAIKPDYFLEDSSVISNIKKYNGGNGINIHGFQYIEHYKFRLNAHRYWVLMKRI